jgi:hypothetical protein
MTCTWRTGAGAPQDLQVCIRTNGFGGNLVALREVKKYMVFVEVRRESYDCIEEVQQAQLVLRVRVAGLPYARTAKQATLAETVTDPTGAVVPSVAISLTNTETGQAHNLMSLEAL